MRLPVTPFRPIDVGETSARRLRGMAVPAILKTAGFGYDGKGQVRSLVPRMPKPPGTRSRAARLCLSASSISSRRFRLSPRADSDGSFAALPTCKRASAGNSRLSRCPSPCIRKESHAEAVEITRAVLEKLDVVGVLCVEFFVTHDGSC